MVVSLSYSQKEAVKNIFDVKYTPTLFTLEIALPVDIPEIKTPAQLKCALWSFFENYIKNDKKLMKSIKLNKGPKVYDVQLAESSKTL